MKVGARDLVWSELRTWDYLIDFNQLFGEKMEYSVAYAVCYIRSDAARTGILMKVGSDDQSKVYLNGREIYRSEAARDYLPDQDVVPGVELRAGLNVLVFKVVNEALNWFGSVRFTDSASQPLEGIQVTLTPP